ncbi:hypothetical protein IFVP408_C140083 [Vibrio parahaemolyticus]
MGISRDRHALRNRVPLILSYLHYSHAWESTVIGILSEIE